MHKSDVLAELPKEIREAVEFQVKDRGDELEVTHPSVTNEVFHELYDTFVKRLGGRYIPATASDETIRRYWVIPKRQGVTPLSVSVENSVAEKEETLESEEPYNLEKSVQKIGKLYPVLKDKFGNVIDGFHRLEIDANWPSITLDHIDTPLKLQKARLTSNFHRRKMPKEEMDEAIGFLIGAGLKPDEIAEEMGIGRSTVFKHMPPAYKDKVKIEAGRKGGEATAALRVDQTRKTQDTTNLETKQFREIEVHAQKQLVDCGICGKTIHKSKAKPYKDKLLCPDCWESLPKEYRKVVAIPEPRNQVSKPSDFESWPDKKARMQPQKSNYELSVVQDLQAEGIPLETDREFCLLKTVPDAVHKKKRAAIYIDGAVHEGKQDRDERIRQQLADKHDFHVLTVEYKNNTEQERERGKQEIRDFLNGLEP